MDETGPGCHFYELISRPTIRGIAIPAPLLCPDPGALVSARDVWLRLDTGESIAPERLECELTIGGKRIEPVAEGWEWRIPAWARGLSGTLRVIVAYSGTEYRDTYAVAVRR